MIIKDSPLETVYRSTFLATTHNDEPEWLAAAPDVELVDESPITSIAHAWMAGKPMPGANALTRAQNSLTDADHATEPEALHRVMAALSDDLEAIARARGRVPITKPRSDAAPLDRWTDSAIGGRP
jgi:hypothetical protein